MSDRFSPSPTPSCTCVDKRHTDCLRLDFKSKPIFHVFLYLQYFREHLRHEMWHAVAESGFSLDQHLQVLHFMQMGSNILSLEIYCYQSEQPWETMTVKRGVIAYDSIANDLNIHLTIVFDTVFHIGHCTQKHINKPCNYSVWCASALL